jgi:hemoglobin-like flavoprotein
LEKALAEAFTPKVKEAWVGVYGVIAEQMMLGAADSKA